MGALKATALAVFAGAGLMCGLIRIGHNDRPDLGAIDIAFALFFWAMAVSIARKGNQ